MSISRGSTMAYYRCYLLDGDGKIAQSEDLEADTDGEAITLGRGIMQQRQSHGLEIWQGRERIHKETRNPAQI
jgi:hypothetical protein